MSVSVPQRAGDDAKPATVGRPDGLLRTGMLVRSVRKEVREVDWVASTEAVDSYDTVIRQDWDGEHKGLDRYRANPVILFAHNSRALPIGRATRVEVEKSGTPEAALVTTVKFATAKANPMAEYCWQSVLEETLLGMSVGWLPGGYERIEIGGVLRTVFIRNTLYEQSVCPVPSNPEALARIAQRAFGDRVFSFLAPAEQRTTPQTQTPAALAAPSKPEKKAMVLRTLIIDKLSLTSLVRDHAVEIQDGEDKVRVSIPGLVELDMEKRSALARAEKAETCVAELERDVATAGKRATDAETTATKAKEAQGKAEQARDAAIAERAKVELEPLTGDAPWQITPATRDHYAKLAGSDQESYRNLVTEIREKGIKAGALARELERDHLPTRQSDPSPRASASKPTGRSDDGLFAEANRTAEQRAGAPIISGLESTAD